MSTFCVTLKTISGCIFDVWTSHAIANVCHDLWENQRDLVFCFLLFTCHSPYLFLSIIHPLPSPGPHFVHSSLKLHRSGRPTAGHRRTKCLWNLPCVKADSHHCQWLSLCQMKGTVFCLFFSFWPRAGRLWQDGLKAAHHHLHNRQISEILMYYNDEYKIKTSWHDVMTYCHLL